LVAAAWLDRLQAEGSGVGVQGSVSLPKRVAKVVTGPGLVRVLDRVPPGVKVLDQTFWHPRAEVVARLAARQYAEGRRDDLWKLVPRYYRRSAAEEKWDARIAQK
jgi:hypothetical protein